MGGETKDISYRMAMEKLNKEIRATREVKHAAADAIEEYLIYDNIGSNAPTEDQPYEWVESITATTYAAKRAQNVIEQDQQAKREAEAKKKKK